MKILKFWLWPNPDLVTKRSIQWLSQYISLLKPNSCLLTLSDICTSQYFLDGLPIGSAVGTNVSTTPLRQWGFWQCLPFSCSTLRGKHYRHPIAVMGVVDMFGLGLLNSWPIKKNWRWCLIKLYTRKNLALPRIVLGQKK